MNILQIVPALKVGGVERGTVDFARELVKRGHKAIVVSSGGPLVHEVIACGAQHITLPVQKKNMLTILMAISRLVRIIERESIDIVHARSRVPAIIGFCAARKTQATFVTTCHGHYGVHLFSRIMGWGKLVIVGSEVIGRHMVEAFKVPYDRIRLVPRGVDLESFRFHECRQKPPGGEWVIGMIARMTPLKGHTDFLKALAKLVRVRPTIKVFIIGDAPARKQAYKNELLLLTKRLGLERYVEFLGDRNDIPALLERMDLLVLPTVEPEAFGRVLIEAGACGVPVVATRVGGVVEVISHEETGLLVPAQDPERLMQAMLTVLKDREYAARLTTNFRKKIEQDFSLERMTEQTLRVYDEARLYNKILIIKFGAVGDVILVSPSIRAIREKYPHSHITVVVGKPASPIMRRCPYTDDVITYDWKGKDRGPLGFLRLARRLCAESFDMSIDLQNNKQSHLLAFLSGIPRRYGYKNKKLGFLLNHGTPDLQKNMLPVEHQFRLLNYLGISPQSDYLELWVREDDERAVDRFFKQEWIAERSTLVGMHIGGSFRWQSKRWPLTSFVRLADELAKRKLRVLLIGGPEDESYAERFMELTKVRPVMAVGKTSLIESAALIKRCAVFVTGDSAPLHLAASVGVPVVALFGPTDPARHLPPLRKHVLLHKQVSCAPCYQSVCDTDHRCLKNITVNEVLRAIDDLLKK